MIVTCGYGHAALSTNLQISGEAMVVHKDPSFGITYMQEMTSDICKNAEIGTEEQLIDKRDNKKYWVKKMANSGCWMLQNLEFVITQDMIDANFINSVLTDIQASTVYDKLPTGAGDYIYVWNSKAAYPPKPTEVIASRTGTVTKVSNDQNGTYSWYFGNTFSMDQLYTTACPNTKNLTLCNNFADPGVYTSGLSYKQTGKVYNADTKLYDSHFNAGVYYQFNTITAGAAGGKTSQDITSSLCPKGWQLPLINGTTESDKKSLYGLLTKYGYSTGQNGTYNGVTRNVSQDPLYFVRAGYVLASAANPVQYAQSRGYLWGNWAGTSAQAYFSRVSGTSLTRRSVDSRYYGFSARCVAR